MSRTLRYAILGADLLWIAAVLVFAQFQWSGLDGDGGGMSTLVLLPPVLAAISIWVVLYFTKQLDCFRLGWHLPSVCAQVTVAVCYLVASLLALAFFAKYNYSRLGLLYIAGLLLLGLVSIRGLALRLVTSRSAGSIKRRVVILGAGRVARELAHKITLHPEMSLEVVGLLFASGADPAGESANVAAHSISLRTLNIMNLLRENNVHELIIVEPVPPGPETETLISKCRESGMRIHLVPRHYELYLSRAELTEIEDVPLLSLQVHKRPALGAGAKRCIDALGALLLLALSAPLVVLSAGVLYAHKGKAFRKELRCGRNGVPFWMYRLNVDRNANLRGYARILSRFSLTELPQLWNVCKGEMSLVGPRPESPERVKLYSNWQRQRLTVIPGLTGLAQVRGLREEHSSEEKARFDLQYIGQWSLFVDLSLLLQTAWALFARLMKIDSFQIAPALKSRFGRELVTRRMMHADSAQSGAD